MLRSDPEAGDRSISPLHPVASIKRGLSKSVPFLVSLAEVEGIWRGINFAEQESVLNGFFNNFKIISPMTFGLEQDVTDGKMGEVIEKIRNNYFKTDIRSGPEQKKNMVSNVK